MRLARLCIVAAVWLATVAAQSAPTSAAAQIDPLFDWATNGPGAVVAVVDHGKTVFEKAYGFADVEKHRPLDAHSVFDLASITKQFTAMGIMILAERGQLDYDDSVCKFFPEFSPFGYGITVRHLLQHTSGLPDYEKLYHDSGFIATNYPRPAKEAIDTFEPTSREALHFLAGQGKLRFKPGDKWEYSDSGYVVLAQIIEKVSGESYAKFLKKNIFRPAGMGETIVYDETHPKIKNRALSYDVAATPPRVIDYTPLNLIYGDGNVNTTIDDMVKWDRVLYTTKLVKASTLAEAFTAGQLNSGKKFDYGFGWGIRHRHGLDAVEHGGGWVGFRGVITRFPARQFSVIILSNSTHGKLGEIEQKIESIYLTNPT
jgi:CubicO group peptidase (beta-lactamase class C family)